MLHGSAFEIENMNDFDFIFTNHFLHHFDETEIIGFLNVVLRKTGIFFLMNDLKRSKLSYFLYSVFAAVFLHRSFAGYDGQVSILKGFTLPEAKQLIQNTNYPDLMYAEETGPGRIIFFGPNQFPNPHEA
jgi:hypothetical protein